MAQPLILLAIGANLTGLALGVLAVQVALAGVMLTIALRRAPASGPEPELIEEPTAALTEA